MKTTKTSIALVIMAIATMVATFGINIAYADEDITLDNGGSYTNNRGETFSCASHGFGGGHTEHIRLHCR